MTVLATGTQTENPAHWETMRRRVLAALEANYDQSLEIGCMEHGGYDFLATAVMLAVRDRPFDVEAVWAEDRRRGDD